MTLIEYKLKPVDLNLEPKSSFAEKLPKLAEWISETKRDNYFED